MSDNDHDCLTNLRFADDVLLFASSKDQLQKMLCEFKRSTEKSGFVYTRYAPDTQNRQYASMQKIMMLAKLWCDHTEDFESGLRAWELDV